MKRSKLGDVFAINLPNGYKLFQRAYDIPRTGRFIRVFDGLFPDIPNSVAEIVAGPHSYIINFDTIKAKTIFFADLTYHLRIKWLNSVDNTKILCYN